MKTPLTQKLVLMVMLITVSLTIYAQKPPNVNLDADYNNQTDFEGEYILAKK